MTSFRKWARHTRLLLVLGLVAGCMQGGSTRWSPATTRPDARLQWPYLPSAAKVVYDRALAGLTPNRNAATVLRSVVLGQQDENDAFVMPVAVAIGRDGRMAVADMGRRCVHLYVPASARYVCLSGTERERIGSPVGVAFDENSGLYVTDASGRLFGFDAGGAVRFVTTSAGAQRLQRPTGIAYSPARKVLFVVDTLAHAVRVFGTDGEFQSTFGSRGTGDGEFNFPTHITVAPSGELYVTDALNFRVVIFDDRGRAAGSFGHHGDGSGDIAMPKGIAVDRSGTIYVVDALFDNVQMFNRSGEFLLTIGGRGVGFGEFWLPSGAFIDEHGDLYVCDTYNRRVQVFRIVSGYENRPA